MTNKLFKDSASITNYNEYNQFIEKSLKSLGFSESADKEYYELKLKLFYMLYQEILNNGPSFDVEIFFSSLISDLNETFDEVGPSLLQIQRVQNDV